MKNQNKSKKTGIHSTDEVNAELQKADLVIEQEKTTSALFALSVNEECQEHNSLTELSEDEDEDTNNREMLRIMAMFSPFLGIVILLVGIRFSKTVFKPFGVIPYVFASGFIIIGALLFYKSRKK